MSMLPRISTVQSANRVLMLDGHLPKTIGEILTILDFIKQSPDGNAGARATSPRPRGRQRIRGGVRYPRTGASGSLDPVPRFAYIEDTITIIEAPQPLAPRRTTEPSRSAPTPTDTGTDMDTDTPGVLPSPRTAFPPARTAGLKHRIASSRRATARRR